MKVLVLIYVQVENLLIRGRFVTCFQILVSVKSYPELAVLQVHGTISIASYFILI